MKSGSPKSGTYPRTLPTNAGPHVLIAGDDEAADMYALYLRRSGFDVVLAQSHDHAQLVAAVMRVDIVVADYDLLDDALALTCRMQSDPRTWNIPVLVLTIVPKDAARRVARATGASGLLSKPCLPEQLEAELRRMLALAKEGAPVVRASHLRIA